MRNLSGLDAIFLRAETPSTPMNVIATIVLDRGRADALSGGGARRLDFEAIVQRLAERIHLMTPFRQRLVETPFGLDQPAWIDDPDFDLRDHVMQVVVPSPGTREHLERVVARIAERPLDRSRPLWELWVVEGLEDDRMAIVTKAHHAALDGVSGAALLLHLFDRPEAIEPLPSAQAWQGEREPTPAELLSRAAGRLRERGAHLGDAARCAGGSLARILRSRIEAAAPVRDAALPFTAPTTSWNRPLSTRRSVAYTRTPLDQVATIRAAFGGTINDVVLAACTAALRDYLIEHDELPDGPLVASIPISTRSFDDGPGGNHISAMLAALPVHIDEPMHRYWEVCRSARDAKRFHGLLGDRAIAAFAELSPGPLVGSALRLYSRWKLASLHRPLHNLVISNVPGPGVRLALAGAPVEALHPHGPLMEGAGLNITVMSYAGSLDIGVLACRESLPQIGLLANGIATAIEALAKQADEDLSEHAAKSVRLRAVG